jgi:hypothetical protein
VSLHVAKKYPAQYFAGMVALARIMRWEVGKPSSFDCPRTPEEIMNKLEERVGPEARKLFERFLRRVRQLEERNGSRHRHRAPLPPPAACTGVPPRRHTQSRGQG